MVSTRHPNRSRSTLNFPHRYRATVACRRRHCRLPYRFSPTERKYWLMARDHPSICARCRSFLERPDSARFVNAIERPLNFTPDSVTRDCRFCKRLLCICWRWFEPEMTAITFSFRICFYDRDPPTPTTRCYIDFRMHEIKDEQVQRGYVKKFTIKPAFTRHALGGRTEFPEYTIFRPLTTGNAQSNRALELVED
jgi:hypothetical protein